ncbi:MAG: CRISPR-associated protein [Rhabdochlamydiaceae bacterium]
MEKTDRKEILFYYESRQNPNGDPGFDNKPREMYDQTIMVTDVRLKRTIRDYAKKILGKKIFVDIDAKGKNVIAFKRLKDFKETATTDDAIEVLLENSWDVPLFGAFVPETGKSNFANLTGPVQFNQGRSTNQVEIIHPQISSHFVGEEKKDEKGNIKIKQHGTFGSFYSVEFALIKFHGVVNPSNFDNLWDKYNKKFNEVEKELFDCIWYGTNELQTRSKWPQQSHFLLEVTYDNKSYNDLSSLVIDVEQLKGKIKGLEEMNGKRKFDLKNLVKILNKRKPKSVKVRISEDFETERGDLEEINKIDFV